MDKIFFESELNFQNKLYPWWKSMRHTEAEATIFCAFFPIMSFVLCHLYVKKMGLCHLPPTTTRRSIRISEHHF